MTPLKVLFSTTFLENGFKIPDFCPSQLLQFSSSQLETWIPATSLLPFLQLFHDCSYAFKNMSACFPAKQNILGFT